MRRFPQPPKIIVYDNACKLHAYVLNREPKRFQNSRFHVDRLHFRVGHVGCSIGYDLRTYQSDKSILQLNSQINEQANSGLRRIQTQLTYMTPGNIIHHTALFLGLRNMDRK